MRKSRCSLAPANVLLAMLLLLYPNGRAWFDEHTNRFRYCASSRGKLGVRNTCKEIDRVAKGFGEIYEGVQLYTMTKCVKEQMLHGHEFRKHQLA